MRGQAYAVFEDLQLADFGNRIPSLTFEVIADAAAVSVGQIAAAFGAIAEDPGRALAGFSAYGDSRRGVLETLAGIDGAWFAAGDDGIVMRSGTGSPASIDDAGMAADGKGARRARTLSGAIAAPARLAVAHYDPARDYQAGLQRASWPGAGGREERIELPVAVDAGTAKAVAESMLARAQARRERRTVALGAEGFSIAPGDRVKVTGEAGQWRVARATLEQMVMRLELERIAPAPVAASASSGRAAVAPDHIHGPTVLQAFEIPPADDIVLSAPRLTIAAAGGPGWRRAALLLSTDDGARWSNAGAALAPATMGTVTVPPGLADGLLVDRASGIEVALLHDGMVLADADPAGLDAGANLALVGDELVQFGRAEPLGGTAWRLSELWRGRRGTEWACAAHVPGERFVLIEPDVLTTVPLALANVGGAARVLASGVGDESGPAAAECIVSGGSVAPPAPVHLHWVAESDGGATIRWTRRSRAGWRWADGGDAPLVEEAERYRVTIGTYETVVSVSVVTIPAEARSSAIAVTVRHLGTLAESRAATIVVPAG